MIRIPDVPGLRGQAVNSPEVSVQAATAPMQGLGKIAQAVAGVGEHFQGVADRVQKLRNAELESTARNELASGYANLQIELEKDPDPASRIEKARAFFAQSKGLADNPELPPIVRDRLRLHHDDFSNRGLIQVAGESARLQQKRTALQLTNELDTAVRGLNMDEASGVIDRGVEGGILLPEEGEAQKRELGYKIQYGQLQQSIPDDPLAAEKQFSDPKFLEANPDLTYEAVESLRSQATQAANRYRADFANDIIISGVMPTAEELKGMEEDGLIDKSTHARWASKIRAGAQPVMDPAIYEEAYGQIMAYDPAKDPSGFVEAKMRSWLASLPLPAAAVTELNERFTKHLNPVDAKKPKSVHEQSFSSKIKNEFSRGDFGKFRFPTDHDNNKYTEPVMVVDREEYDKAWKLAGQFAEDWRAVLGSMPEDVPFKDVTEAYETLKKSYNDKKPVPDLKFSPADPIPFDPEAVYESTTPGGKFGGQPIKPAGEIYQGAAATVFGGPNDPADNGQSAFGGKTGEGGREGTAIPQDLLKAKFPGKNKAWIAENVRTVVRAPNGVAQTLQVADFGTAEWVWQRAGRPTLDLTENAVKQLGGDVVYNKAGKMQGVRGLDNLDFAVVSIDTGGTALAGSSWEDAKSAWFKANMPRSYSAATNSLIALRDEWNKANMDDPTRPKITDAMLRFPTKTKFEHAFTTEPPKGGYKNF